MIRTRPFRLGAAVTAFLLGAAGADTLVMQKDKEFSQARLALHRGETVQFRNDDSVVHNITVRDASGASRRGTVQKPGDMTPITFADIGAYTVYCLIHPKMRMEVKVQ